MNAEMTTKKRRAHKEVRPFTRPEEIAHAATHCFGAVLGIAALILMIGKATTTAGLVSAVVFGVSLILLYAASGIFHASCAVWGKESPCRFRDFTEKCDHSLIFLLILGTYTPACLAAMGGVVGYALFALVGACCAVGFVLNVINVEKFFPVSLTLYVVSGWAIAAAVVPFYRAVGAGGVTMLLAGGVSYTVGLIFYGLRRIPDLHIIWHLLVLGGSVFHFFMVYSYCL